jgi:carboxyl-terminal processing protease
MKQIIKSYRSHILFLVLLCLFLGFKWADTDYFFKIQKSIDIFGRVYKEITMNYVDEIDPEKFMESGVDGLLATLDPYTQFISEQEGDEVELITTGKYGGIGVSIGVRDGYITILSLMEGYSAQRQGILPGDRILEIDMKSVVGSKPDDVRSLTRGEPGTEVHLKIEREGESQPLTFVLVREEIQLKNVTYADFIKDDIAYVRLDRFARSAGDELRLAIKELRLKGTMKGIILDLRDNPGGLLDAAVDVVEKFVPKGSLVVSTKGRRMETEKKYTATEEPMLPDVPLIVLVNKNSASASEIVAGAIQDLDRGIILGTRSFGKGLVQTVVPLAYNTQLKITTAKYYTPSGRCIQQIDYMHKDKDGIFAVKPDSMKQEFKTLKGRSVFESGGVYPDTIVGEREQGTIHKELLRKLMYFKFATRYSSQHKELQPMLKDDQALLKDFRAYLDEQQFSYQDDGEKKVSELKELAHKLNYNKSTIDALNHLDNLLQDEKKNALELNKTQILQALRMEIMSRYEGEKGRVAASLADDVQVSHAMSLLKNNTEYRRLLTATSLHR